MSLKLGKTEAPYTGLRRLLLEQCESMLRALRNDDVDHGIHETRKCCKRARAILRLLKPVLPAESKDENKCFRSVARDLAAYRDRKVTIECFERLLAEEPQATQKFQPLHDILQSVDADMLEMGDRLKTVKTVMGEIKEARTRISRWELPEHDDDWDELLSGVKKCYQCARVKMESLTAGDGSFHNWRKRVKELACYFKMLRDSWPEVMKATDKELGKLGKLLGDENDLSVLQSTLYEKVPGADTRMMKMLEAFEPLLISRRKRLRVEAKVVGVRLFTEKPKAIKRRLSGYVNAWLQEEVS